MKRIFKLAVLLLAVTGFQSCKKQDDSNLPKEDYSSFLNTGRYMLMGTLPDSSRIWRHSASEFHAGYGRATVGSGSQPQKSLSFYLVDDLSTSFQIFTPAYNAQSDELFSKTLAEGKKEIGGQYDKFELNITVNNTRYTTIGDQANSELKVLQMEKSKDDFDRDVVFVWFKVNCTFYSTVDTSSFKLKDGLLLAGFMYNL